MDTLIRNDIEQDFYNCLGLYWNCYIIMDNYKELEIKDNDSDEIIKFKQGRINSLLVDLGRVGELAFKYLLKLKQINLYPNQSYEQFSNTEKIFMNGPIKNLAKRNIISEEDANEILSFIDENNQKFHNFMYLGLIVKKLMPNVYNNLEKCIDYSFQSEAVLDVIRNMDDQEINWEVNNGYYCKHAIFPCLLWTGSLDVNNEKIDRIISKIKSTTNNSGDIFTRLRYSSNNKDNKKYSLTNLHEIFVYMKNLIKLIDGIHRNNNNLLTNPEVIHGREYALKYSSLIGRSKEEINQIFDMSFEEDPLYICQKLFSDYSISELQQLEDIRKKDEIDGFMIMEHGIKPDEYYLLYDICDDYLEMQEYIFDDNGNRRSLEEIKKLIESKKTK